jgi:hypothetical protein
MNYDEAKTNSSWDKLTRKQHKKSKKGIKDYQDFDMSSIPDSYIGNEDVWADINEELEDLYG